MNSLNLKGLLANRLDSARRRVLAFAVTSAVAIVAQATTFAHDGRDHANEDLRAALLAKDYQPFDLSSAVIANSNLPGNEHINGQWGPLINWPHVPVSAANLPDGRILTWASNEPDGFPAGPNYTHATIWNPFDNSFQNVPHNNHDMFCAHNVMLADGRIFINGGRHTPYTTLFDPSTNSWLRLQNMARGRWYPTTVAMPDGRVFTGLGGSGGTYGEIWQDNVGWTRLTGFNFNDSTMAYKDQGADATDPHYEYNWWPYFALTSRGKILHYGPTPKMQLLDVNGNGSAESLGTFTRQWYPKHGAAVMYRQGKILLAGGATSGTNLASTNKTMLLDISGETPTLDTSIPNMNYTRKFHNAVVLPNGEVVMMGGNQSGLKFDDSNSRLEGEIWNPSSQQFRPMAVMNAPRNYHSVGLLMTDGRVLSGGGGLYGPNSPVNHLNIQIYSPPYLFASDGSLAPRPSIYAAPRAVNHGATIRVQASPGVSYFSLIRMSATTHAVNTDMRRIQAPTTETSNGWYDVEIHPNENVLVPGYYMMFAVTSTGTPSISHIIQVNAGTSVENYDPSLTVPINPILRRGVAETLSVSVQDIDSDSANFQFSATGLPPGMTINANTGRVSGTPTLIGNYEVTISVNDGDGGTDSETNLWVVANQSDVNANPDKGFRYDYYEGSWNVLPDFSQLTPKKSGITTDFDIVRLADIYDLFGFRFQGYILITKAGDYSFHVRSNDGSRLWIDNELVVDNDGIHGGQEVSGTTNLSVGFHRFQLDYFDKEDGHALAVEWNGPSFARTAVPPSVQYRRLPDHASNAAPVLASPGNLSSEQNKNVDVALSATDADDDPLTFSATGLPPGLNISAAGRITGRPTTPGTFPVVATVSDPLNATDSKSFNWTINVSDMPPLSVEQYIAPPAQVGTSIRFTLNIAGGINPTVRWDFGDDSSPVGPRASATATHTYSSPGRYIVVARVTSEDGVVRQIQFVQTIHRARVTGKAQSSSSIVFEPKAGGASRVWTANPDNDTVSVHSASTMEKLAEIAVGRNPRSVALAPNGKIWVSNRLSNSVSIIDPDTYNVSKTVALRYGSQPHGIVFSPTGNIAWLVLTGSRSLAKLNANTGDLIATTVMGGVLRHVSINHDGSRILLPRWITPRLDNEFGKFPVTVQNGNPKGGQVLLVRTSDAKILHTIILRHSDRIDAENGARGIPNYLGAAAFSTDGASAWIPSKQDNIKRGQFRDSSPLTHDSTVRAITSKISLVNNTEVTGARVDHDDAGMPSSAAFGPNGVYLYITLEASRHVVMLDAYQLFEVARFNVGRAPQGIAVAPSGQLLYVHNFMDRSITRINVTPVLQRNTPTPIYADAVSTVSTEKLLPTVLQGKRFFLDARDNRLASQDYMSCASCHADGGHDGRVWDRFDIGEGLRNTIDLRGRAGMAHGPLHWSGNFDEVQDFEGQIRSFAGGSGLMSDPAFNTGSRHHPLGDGKTGASADLDALAQYVASLNKYPPSPHRRANGKFTTDGEDGKKLFVTKGCSRCHSGTNMTDSAFNVSHDVGTVSARTGKRIGQRLTGIDTPTVRGAWATAPYLHDGSASTIEEAILAHTNVSVNNTQLNKLASYIRQLEGPDTDGRDPNIGDQSGPGEVGRIFVTQADAGAWRTVNLSRAYSDPIVVATVVSYNDPSPVTVRVRSVRPSSFDIKLDEWDHMDGAHGRELVSFIVVEAGVHRLAGGGLLMAGNDNGTGGAWKSIGFPRAFPKQPVVFATPVTTNESSAVTSRIRGVTASGFNVRLQEEEASDGSHAPEHVNWIAISKGSVVRNRDVNLLRYVDHRWRAMRFRQQYTKTPVVLAASQQARASDVAVLRHNRLNRKSVLFRLQEERSKDAEMTHPREIIGYAVFPAPGPLR